MFGDWAEAQVGLGRRVVGGSVGCRGRAASLWMNRDGRGDGVGWAECEGVGVRLGTLQIASKADQSIPS